MRAGEPSGGRRRRRRPGWHAGSSPVMMPWITVTGSRPSASGHLAHRGCPARSREETGLAFPHAAHGSARCSQGAQYQSWPRRWKVRSCLPHRAQHGGETDRAPASAQRQEQVADGPGRRGPAVGQHRGTVSQGRGQAARLGAAARDGGDHRADLLRRQPGLDRRDQVRDQPDRVADRPLAASGAGHGRPAP